MKNSVVITAIFVALCFTSVIYISCNKKESTASTGPCTGVVCNNGNCIDGKCVCLSGFEGDKCDKSSRSRYLGEWLVSEKITGSSKPANINKTRGFNMKIDAQPGSNIGLLLDNFMGNAAYNDIEVYVSKKLNEAQMQYENDAPTNFVFSHTQKIPGTNITILKGNGNITNIGDEIHAVYILETSEGGIPVLDTVSLNATFMQ